MYLMKKTVAVIASCDTKFKEAQYIRECLETTGINTLVVDMAIGFSESIGADISREKVVGNIGLKWYEIKDQSKGELMGVMLEAIPRYIKSLYDEGKIDGVLAVGGLQNTLVATKAMQQLPLGFPKVMATTIASGGREFSSVVGDKDIIVIPSIADFTGLNIITRRIIENACYAVSGIVKHGSGIIRKEDKKVIGISLMGVTDKGAKGAIEELERFGIEGVGFHSTGVGGPIMEQQAISGLFDGIIDLTTHEITSEYFGGGFSYGASNRMVATAKAGIPMVVSVGGLDFIDYSINELPKDMDKRQYNLHNPGIAHIKILPHEAKEIGKIYAQYLNNAKSHVVLLLPTDGMRSATQKGESLYNPEVDKILMDSITENLNSNIEVKEIIGNLDNKEWGARAAREILRIINKKD